MTSVFSKPLQSKRCPINHHGKNVKDINRFFRTALPLYTSHVYDELNLTYRRLHRFSSIIQCTAPRFLKRGLVPVDNTFEDLIFALPLYQHVAECEQDVMSWSEWQSPQNSWDFQESEMHNDGKIQSDEITLDDVRLFCELTQNLDPTLSISTPEVVLDAMSGVEDSNHFTTYLSRILPKEVCGGVTLRVVEAICDFVLQLSSLVCHGKSVLKDLLFPCCRQFVRAITGTSLTLMIAPMVDKLIDWVHTCCTPMQSEEQPFNPFGVIQKLFSSWEQYKDHTLVVKLRTLLHKLIGAALLPTWGIKMHDLLFSRAETEAIARQNTGKLGFIASLVDTVTWIGERLVNVYYTKSWNSFLLNGKDFAKWADSCYEIKILAQQLYDPESCGFTYNEFVGKVDACLEQGKNILTYAGNVKSTDVRTIKRLLNEIRLIKGQILTTAAASEMRPAPFPTLLYGGSCLGKSSIVAILESYFAKLFALPSGPEYKYTRTFGEKHWNNFLSSCIYCTLDDISAKNANLEPDLSMSEIIQILNNISFMPEQAALEGKGKTPFRAQFVTATTNSKHLYAHVYYWSTLAIRRRFPLITTVTVKAEYAQEVDGQIPEPYDRMLDASKVPKIPDGQIPDLWEFTVEKVVAAPTQENIPQSAETRVVASGLDIFSWLQLMGQEAHKHRCNQMAMLSAKRGYDDIEVCSECFQVKHKCECTEDSEEEWMCETCEELTKDCTCSAHNWDSAIQSQDILMGFGIMGIVMWIWFFLKRQFSKAADSASEILESRLQEFSQNLALMSGELLQQFPVISAQIVGNIQQQIPDMIRESRYALQAEAPPLMASIDEHVSSLVQNSMQQIQLNMGSTVGQVADKVQFEIPNLVATAISSAKDEMFGGIRRAYNDVEHKIHTKKRVVKDWLLNLRSSISFEGLSVSDLLREEASLVSKYFLEMGEGVRSAILPSALMGVIACVPLLIGVKYLWNYFHKPAQGTDVPGKRIDAKDEKANVWHCDDYIPSVLETGSKSRSWKALDVESVNKRILSNIDYVRASYVTAHGEAKARDSRILALGGQLYVTSNHCMPEVGRITLDIVSMSRATQISRNARVTLEQSDFIRFPEKDLVFFQLKNLPPRVDLKECIPSETFQTISPGFFLSRGKDGSDRCVPIKNVRRIERYIHQLDRTISSWSYNIQEATQNGDCGSPIIAQTHFGPHIVALHQMEQNFAQNASGPMLTRELVAKVVEVTSAKLSTLQSNAPILLDARDVEIHLMPLHHKSPFRYISEGSATVYGSVPVSRSSYKSEVVDTAIRSAVEARGYVCEVGPPCMKGWEPWSHAIKDIVQQSFVAEQSVIDQCVDSFSHEILQNLPRKQLKDIVVLEDLAVVNGLPGVRFIDKMKRNTSMGFPYNKKKTFFLSKPKPVDIWQDCVDFDEKFYSRVQTIIDRYRDGERHMPVFMGHLKDEPTKLQKIRDKKTRVFLGGPADWAFVVRKYLLGFVRVVQNNKYVFEAAPGTNATSPEWERLYKYLTHFGENNMVAGDFSKFDKRMSAQWILAAFQVIENIWRQSPHWEEEYAKIIRGIATDTAFPLCNMNGDLVQFWGSNPSGHPLTVIINSIVNSLYMRYAWVKSGHELGTFKKHVHLMTYGDDNVMGIDPEVWTFNHTVIRDELGRIGVVYTMADKERESIPRIHISEISFLKRYWRWEPELGQHVAQLEEASIAKSLTKCLKSKSICLEAQAIATMTSAVHEYFMYGRQVFEEKRQMFLDIIDECDLGAYYEHPFPTYDVLKAQYLASDPYDDSD